MTPVGYPSVNVLVLMTVMLAVFQLFRGRTGRDAIRRIGLRASVAVFEVPFRLSFVTAFSRWRALCTTRWRNGGSIQTYVDQQKYLATGHF
jgi:hypothetical protein